MTPADALRVIVAALKSLDLDLRRTRDRRIYCAYLAGCVALGDDGALERRLTQLRRELGL